MWTNFAKTGHPTPDNSLKFIWDPVGKVNGEERHLEISAEETSMQQITDHEKSRLELWRNEVASKMYVER